MAFIEEKIRVSLIEGNSAAGVKEELAWLREKPTVEIGVNLGGMAAQQLRDLRNLSQMTIKPTVDLSALKAGLTAAEREITSWTQQMEKRLSLKIDVSTVQRSIRDAVQDGMNEAAKSTSSLEQRLADMAHKRGVSLQNVNASNPEVAAIFQRASGLSPSVSAQMMATLAETKRLQKQAELQGLNFLKEHTGRQQVALAALGHGSAFGAVAGVAGAVAGGIAGGPAGALAGAEAVRLGEAFSEALLGPFRSREKDFQEAGREWSESVLGMTSSLQQSAPALSALGKPLLAAQEARAAEIQNAARGALLPLGIAGSGEATTVRAVLSALGARGMQGSPGQIAEIARNIAGVAVTQRPGLIENTNRYTTDVEDLLSGLPSAARTTLGGTALRSAIPDLARANSVDDVALALRRFSSSADVAAGSNNLSALENRYSAARNQLDTAGGRAFFEDSSFKPAIQEYTKALSSKESVEAAKNLGKALGEFSAIAVKATAAVTPLANAITTGLVQRFEFLQRFFAQTPQGKAFFSQQDSEKQDQMGSLIAERIQAANASGSPQAIIDAAVKRIGLDDELSKLKAGDTQGAESQLAQLSSLKQLYGRTPAYGENAAEFASLSFGARQRALKERGEFFGPGAEGDISRAELFRDELPKLMGDLADKQFGLIKKRDELSKPNALRGLDRDIARLEKQAEQLRRSSEVDAPAQRAEALSQVRQLQAKREGLLRSGDPALGGINRQLVDTQKEILSLKDTELEVTQKETAARLEQAEKIKSKYNLTTSVGIGNYIKSARPELDQALGSEKRTIKGIDELLTSTAVFRQRTADSLKTTSDPGVRAVLGNFIQDLGLRSKQLNRERKSEIDKANAIEHQRIDLFGSGQEGVLMRYARQRDKFDRGTYAGKTAYSLSEADELRDRGRYSAQNILDLKEKIRNNPGSYLNRARKEALETEQKKLAAAGTALPQKLNESRLDSFDQQAGPSRLSLALEASSRAITEEQTKRLQLTDGLRQAKDALDAFSAKANSAIISKQEQLVGIAKQLQESGEAAPSWLANADTGALKIAGLKAGGNALGQELGFGENIFGIPQGLAMSTTGTPLGNQLQAEFDQKQASFNQSFSQLQTFEPRANLERLGIERTLFEERYKNGPAQPDGRFFSDPIDTGRSGSGLPPLKTSRAISGDAEGGMPIETASNNRPAVLISRSNLGGGDKPDFQPLVAALTSTQSGQTALTSQMGALVQSVLDLKTSVDNCMGS